jgi:multicomponent Na+:H+ antiporter subunit E
MNLHRVRRSLPLFVVVVGTWLLLQGQWSAANLLGGAAIALVLLVMFPLGEPLVGHTVHPWAFVKLIVFVLYSLVMSSWAVIKVILRPTPENLRAGVVRIRLETESPLTSTIVANAITLTPGTMTLTARLDPAEVHVHALSLGDLDEFRGSVHDLERRTTAAFTPRPADPVGRRPPAGRTDHQEES